MSIYSNLYDWQQKIVDSFSYKKNFGIFLKMGLGKTPISLAFAERHQCTKIIVITLNTKATEPQTLRGSWLYWASQTTLHYDFCNKHTSTFDTAIPQLLLINYEALFSRSKTKKSKVELKENLQAFVKSCKMCNVALIVDESHKVKNSQSMQSLAISKLKKELKRYANEVYCYLLTGTPFTNGYIDLYAQLALLGYPETKTYFIDQFCVRGNIKGLLGWQQPIVGYKNVDEIFKLLHQYAITMESNLVVKFPEQIFIEYKQPLSTEFTLFVSERLPSKVIYDYMKSHQKPLEVNSEHIDSVTLQNRYDSLLKKKTSKNPFYRDLMYDITKVYPSSKFLAEEVGTFWLRCRQLSIGFIGNAEECEWFDRRRLNEFKNFLEIQPDNYVIFYNFTPELIELYDICEQLGYNIDVYCGEVKSMLFYEQYEKMTDSERLTHKKNVILTNYASGSTGKNWQLYNSCILFSIPVYRDYEQCLARICRLGQNNTTFYYLFYQDNWLDNGMRKSLETKCDYNSKMFDSDLTRINNIIENKVIV